LKTAWLLARLACVAVLLAAGHSRASWNVSADADLRYRLSDWQHHGGGLHVAGVSVRKTLADRKGDRLILFGLIETHDNFADVMPHELYARYKGPMGSWNLTLGRFGLPYGLLSGFTASRLLYDTPYRDVLGFAVDNGVMLSGVVGMVDYAVSATQGYGPHHVPGFPGHGLGVGRVGLTLGSGAELIVGVSGVHGWTAQPHDPDHAVERALGGVDATAYLGRLLCRVELSAGMVESEFVGAGFAAFDFALLPRMDINLAVTGMVHGEELSDAWFAGVTVKPKWFTLRGGYRYARYDEPHHQVALQVYRLFSFTF
jgi:hypothetical protein